MRYPKYLNALFVTGLAVFIFCQSLTAQINAEAKNDSKKLAIKNMVDSQHFVFEAQFATPLRGGYRNLTSEYDVRISHDTLVCYLPYFGRATVAPIDPSKGALDFTSTSFSYDVTPRKKNGWNVTIKPKDKSDIQQLLFTIYDNGSANLIVSSASRDAISFNGTIKKGEKKRKKNS